MDVASRSRPPAFLHYPRYRDSATPHQKLLNSLIEGQHGGVSSHGLMTVTPALSKSSRSRVTTGVSIEYVPDMAVFHYHGRKSRAEAQRLFRNYMTGVGALYAKHFVRHPNLCRPLWWDIKNAVREVFKGTDAFFSVIGFSHTKKLRCIVVGSFRFARLNIQNFNFGDAATRYGVFLLLSVACLILWPYEKLLWVLSGGRTRSFRD
jgi:hypothetical protein